MRGIAVIPFKTARNGNSIVGETTEKESQIQGRKDVSMVFRSGREREGFSTVRERRISVERMDEAWKVQGEPTMQATMDASNLPHLSSAGVMVEKGAPTNDQGR